MAHVRFLPWKLAFLLLVAAIAQTAYAHTTGAWLTSTDGTGPWGKINSSSVALAQLGFADFDGNGKTDVFRSAGGTWLVSFDGVGPWHEINTSSIPLDRLRFGNFDGNAKADIFRSTGGTWFVSFDGVGPWQEINTSSIGVASLAFGDFDGNGKTDVFRANGSRWFVSFDGTGPWQEINTSSLGVASLAFGDFDGNGKTDVFRANGSKWFVSFDGTGSWQEINTSSLGVTSLRFADFDGNGKTDVFRANGESWFVSFDGTSRWQQINISSFDVTSLRFGDFDGNGRADVFRKGDESHIRLMIFRYTTASLDDAGADAILENVSTILQTNDGAGDRACLVHFARIGNVTVFAQGDGSIDSKAEYRKVRSFGGSQHAPLPMNTVKVVNQINFCKVIGAFYGCAGPGRSQVVIRRPTREGALWAHEYGHTQGLDHNPDAAFVMAPGSGPKVNQSECTAIRN